MHSNAKLASFRWHASTARLAQLLTSSNKHTRGHGREIFNVLILAHHRHRVIIRVENTIYLCLGKSLPSSLSLWKGSLTLADTNVLKSTFYIVLFCSHISWLLTWIQGIYLNKNACPRNLSWCVSHILKTAGFICLNCHWRQFGLTHTRPLQPGSASVQSWTQAVCVVDPCYTLDCSGNKPVVWFLKVQIYTRFSHLGIIVALRVYILMVKGKKNNNKILFWRRKALQSKRLSPMCVQVNIHI